MVRIWTVILVGGCVLAVLGSDEAVAVSERAKKNIAAIEPLLSEYEKVADEAEKALVPFENSRDEKVLTAVDSTKLRISAIRSVRIIIKTSPDYLAWHLGKGSLEKWKEGIEYYLECARTGKDPFEGMTSGIRPVLSKIDGQILFYVFKLPRDYDPKKKYPVNVGLHSGAGLIWRGGWMDGRPSNDPRNANAAQEIYISPCGRGNNCYAGMGEIAILEAIEHLKKHYAVDENRIYIGGASMGGTGGFRLCGFHPDVFAAGSSLTGGANYSVPVGNGRFDAYLLAENLCNTAFCIWDTPGDGHFKPNRAFAEGLRELAKKYPGYYPNLELTDPKGGHGIIDRKLQVEGREWLKKQVRNPWPKLVVYKTYNLRYDGAYWVTIDMVEDPARAARIEVEFQEPNRLRVATENIARFHLRLRGPILVAQVYEVSINGGPALRWPPGPRRHFARVEGKWTLERNRYPAGLVKKHGVSGPVLDVFLEEPVLMVYGTLQTKDQAKSLGMVSTLVGRWFGPGDGGHTLHTGFERKTDTAVTKDDIARKNLVLFGTPKQNAMVRDVADKLPVKFLDDGVEVAGKTHRGEGVGIIMVYPNPLNPERYVLLVPEDCGRTDVRTLPDYLVGRTVKGYGGMVLSPAAKGNFDAKWQLPGQ